MRTLIENYRGWDIYFDTVGEIFYTVSNQYDKQENKRSFSSAKKYVDDFIKENQNFQPFKIQHNRTGETLTVIGLRKDNRFTLEDKDQLSEYNESNHIVFDPKNEEYFKEIKLLENEITLLHNKKNIILDRIKNENTSLAEYKKILL